MEMTQRDDDTDFIFYCIDQYLSGKVSSIDAVNAINAIVKPATQSMSMPEHTTDSLPVIVLQAA